MVREQSAGAAPLPVVIIGAGLAGLTVALHLAETQPVVVLAKRHLEEAATAWAQGGIVGVLGSDDSIASHVRDTQDAGAGLVDENVVQQEDIVEDEPLFAAFDDEANTEAL